MFPQYPTSDQRFQRHAGRPPPVIDAKAPRGLGPCQSIDTSGTGKVDDDKLSEIVRAHFNLTPKGIIETLNLRRPIYKKTAAFGHFGRTEPEFTWERTDKAAALRKDAGV
jgi:S-adenosylmethionine synthetase